MKPQIVKEIRNSNGILKTYEPEVISRVISEETSQQMREILESVVSLPTSTGKNAYVKAAVSEVKQVLRKKVTVTKKTYCIIYRFCSCKRSGNSVSYNA